eukprot:Ihof_evm2s170 gene=Ihof_evmTU2s170
MTTPPYATARNGFSERMGRQLITMARTSMIDANIPHNFWGYAIAAAAYVHNMMPTTAVGSHIPPMELWFNKRAPIERLHAYGCKIYYRPDDIGIHSKFAPK